ncbi:hypothetical protein OROMI_002215 [Orobanche minor]
MASAESNVREDLKVPGNDAVQPVPANDSNEDDDDDLPMLSSQDLEALKEFITEQAEQAREHPATDDAEDVVLVAEDWRLSQFWYDRELWKPSPPRLLLSAEHSLLLVSRALRAQLFMRISRKLAPGMPAQLIDYDKRFEKYGSEFTFYDYNKPEELTSPMKHSFPIVVADPPYLWWGAKGFGCRAFRLASMWLSTTTLEQTWQ